MLSIFHIAVLGVRLKIYKLKANSEIRRIGLTWPTLNITSLIQIRLYAPKRKMFGQCVLLYSRRLKR